MPNTPPGAVFALSAAAVIVLLGAPAALTTPAWPEHKVAPHDGDPLIELYGTSLAADGDWVFVGATRTGGADIVYAYADASGMPQQPTQRLNIGPGTYHLRAGPSLATDGDRLMTSSLQQDYNSITGANITFWHHANQWLVESSLQLPPPEPILPVALVIDGDTAFAGVTGAQAGVIHRYEHTDAGWTLAQTINSPATRFGRAIAGDAQRLAASSQQGIHILEPQGDAWQQTALLPTDHETFALAIDGDHLLAGHTLAESGRVQAFHYNGSWTATPLPTPTPTSPHDAFGAAIALQGGTAIIGSPWASKGTGAAHQYTFTDRWQHTHTHTAPDAAPGDEFGTRIAIFHGQTIITAPDDQQTGSLYALPLA